MGKSNKVMKKYIKDFLGMHFQNRKFQYTIDELPKYQELIEYRILSEVEGNVDILEINSDSIELQDVLLDIAKTKLDKKLPNDISEAFKFIDQFDDALKKEYECERLLNSFSTIMRGLRGYALLVLHKKGLDVKSFIISLNHEEREGYLYSLERSFFYFLPYYSYSEKEIFEILNHLWDDENRSHEVITGLRELPYKRKDKSNLLLEYAYKDDKFSHFIPELLIGIYNSGETSSIEKIIKLKDIDVVSCLFALGRIKYENNQHAERSYNNIGQLEFKNIKIAGLQSYLISNIIENKHTSELTRKNAFKLYAEYFKNGADDIVNKVFQDLSFINGCESQKYNLLHLYLSKTSNTSVIKNFFFRFKDPKYLFDLMSRSFALKPNYRFPIDLFENGLRHSWKTNQSETENCILNLFKEHSAFGILAVLVILSQPLAIFQVNLLKLNKVEHQINAINKICKHPHSFDKLLPLILPLRDSKLEGVKENLQKILAQKVYSSYHETIFEQIENSISKNKKDKDFIKPIKKALNDYNKLKELKTSINDLDPFENESDLMDLYYRLEHEQRTKVMNEAKHAKGTFVEMAKTSIIVRGNSFKFDDKAPTPLGKIESSMLIDNNSYLNPDLYEYNLNIIE